MKPPNPDKIKPAIPDNGLSIIERIFYNSAPGRPQVIMGIIFRMRCPKQVPELRLQRVLDIVRLAAAQHYRLCVSINPETMTTYSLAQTADQLPIISRAVVDDGNDNWKEVVKEEINTNFDINDPKLPLWKCCIVGSKELVETGKQRHSSPLADAKGKGVDRSGAGVPPAKSASAFDLEVVHDSLDNLVEAESPPSPTFTMSRWSLGRWRNHFRSKNDSTKVVDGIIKHGSFHHDAMDDGAPSFYVMFSFHHCLGDGLSMLAYARTFSEFCDDAHFNPDNLHLENIPVAQSPPPILDNLFDPNVFEVLPAATAMAFNFLKKKPKDRIKGRTLSMLVNEQGDFELDPDDDDDFKPTPKQIDFAQYQQQQQQQLQQQQQSPTEMGPSTVVVAPTAVGQTVTFAAATAQPAPSSSASSSATAGQVVVAAASHSRNRSNPQTLIVSPMKPLRNYTNVRQIWFDSDFTSILRKRAKAERTTIAAVLIVTALGAVRTSFSKLPKYRHRPLPNHQGWVITSSVRFLIPGSNLMNGGDRASDPALRVFGGYGGSIMNANMAYDDYHDFWERCRAVSRSIRTSFRASISRMKLVNYAYRHPKLWKWIESKADLAKLSRSYSVELANIGAWDYPMAPPNADDSDSRLRCDYFGGVVNSSFDGVRGLYTLGVVTLGGNMSVSCAYDVSAVHEVDADNFQKNFSEIMRAIAACEGKISVGKAREQA
ncbi:uncharacterized protein BJ171DRAFT_481470 [Polychytrium aggregatum]|uniref:uncharacterized protein n=1 Tax=Polychytrium aggregatum TaxID=110093 RepID=UPI0022FF2CA1|nr:uncharacterized protein BJ171DRAFT_481470 [Polychytrium aggregatum]KAI9192917.1 hypothetical protein BJ171DRAFT_481470 [Polychytrium aggregatum]